MSRLVMQGSIAFKSAPLRQLPLLDPPDAETGIARQDDGLARVLTPSLLNTADT